MLVDDILANPPRVLTPAQRRTYFERGFVALPDYVPQAWVARLRAATQELIERSRAVTKSDSVFVLEKGHSAQTPMLHRISAPQNAHPALWEFMTDPVMTDLAADVVGRDVKFHHAKLNVKSERGSQGFKWHQDIPGWPHTDYSPVTIGIYLEDCSPEQGPLAFVPGSHLGPLYPSYDAEGNFVGVGEGFMAAVDPAVIETATGRAGTTVLLNCRVVHGSAPNESTRQRPLLLPVYSSADSFPYTTSPLQSPQMGAIVRGQAAQYASFDVRRCPVPPDPRVTKGPWQM